MNFFNMRLRSRLSKEVRRIDLDRLVRDVTQFDDFDHLSNAMSGGYVPTIRPSHAEGMGRELHIYECAHNLKAVELARRLRAAGWKVWDGPAKKAVGLTQSGQIGE